MDCQVFKLQKRDYLPEEYEDASGYNLETDGPAVFAVADGASESGFARPWAEILVDQFLSCASESPLPWEDWLPAAQQSWVENIGDLDSLPWYAEAKFHQGAFATFLGIVVIPASDGAVEWHATAVGDSCLFQTRGPQLLKAFPVTESAHFDTQPDLVGSRTPPEVVEKDRAVTKQGKAASRDRLWLMTDALAQWFLAEYETGNQPWAELELLMADPDAEELLTQRIAELRKSKRMRNDDVTLLLVEL